MSSVTWTAANHVYVLVSDRSMEDLRRLL